MVNFATKTQVFSSQTAPFATFMQFLDIMYAILFANMRH